MRIFLASYTLQTSTATTTTKAAETAAAAATTTTATSARIQGKSWKRKSQRGNKHYMRGNNGRKMADEEIRMLADEAGFICYASFKKPDKENLCLLFIYRYPVCLPWKRRRCKMWLARPDSNGRCGIWKCRGGGRKKRDKELSHIFYF